MPARTSRFNMNYRIDGDVRKHMNGIVACGSVRVVHIIVHHARVCLPACLLACLRAVVPACERACVRACVHACLRARARACVPACVRACELACVRACVRGRACVHACMRVCMRACARVHARVRACVRAFVGNVLHLNFQAGEVAVELVDQRGQALSRGQIKDSRHASASKDEVGLSGKEGCCLCEPCPGQICEPCPAHARAHASMHARTHACTHARMHARPWSIRGTHAILPAQARGLGPGGLALIRFFAARPHAHAHKRTYTY